MKENDLERVKKEVKAILKPDLVYPPNLIKVNYKSIKVHESN
jgi:hypothetical protein